MSNKISVVFNADTQQFVANTDNATKAVARSAEAVAKAKNEIVASFKMQVQAAKEVGASHQELESIQRRAATMIANVSETNADRVINSLNRISEKNKQVAAELGNLKVAVPLGGGGHEVSDRMAASATVRGLENGNPGIRSIENFITTIPGAGKAMQALFPIIGAAGLTGLLFDMGVKGYEAFEKARKAALTLRDAFSDFNAPLELNVDTLRKANDELEISIAHLEHKPANTLALALDEARINADRLASSASKGAAEVKKLLEENKVGFTTWLMTGQQSTGPVADEVNKRMTELKNLQRDNKDAIRSGHDTPEAASARAANIRNKTVGLNDWAHDTRKGVESFARDGVQDSNLNILGGVEDYASGILDEGDEQKRNVTDQKKQKDLQDAEKQRQQASEAQRKSAEAARKAAELQLKSFEDTLNKRKQFEQVDVTDELNYWESKLAPAQRYAENVAKINAKLGELQQRFYRENDADATKAVAAQKKQVEDTKRNFAELLSVMTAWEKQDEERSNSSARLDEAQGRAKIAMQEWTLSQQVATGALTRHDAAVQTAILHASDYAKQLAELDREEAADRQRSTLTDDERATRQNNRDVKRTEIISKRDIQAANDGVTIVATTWQGALKNANAAWVEDARDSAKQVATLFTQTLDGLNENLSALMVGDKSNFAGMFKGIGKTLANDSLKQIESPILGALGIGKADGSDANPFAVKFASGIGGNAGAGWLAGFLNKGSGDDSDSKSSGGFLGGVGSFFGSIFGGHRALGGGVRAGVAYDVGEMGRETFIPQTNGTIVPHNKVSGGGIAYYNVQVANGVTPEQMNMHMRAALQEFHPIVVGDSIKASRAYPQRNPSSAR